ncbi:Vacuolar protein sorting-associated protein VTA1 -like protein [Toxocara canis]|uniref:Vacuolar protein sorting-associated protein VTA1-like protein n=1 Tax=Toxocara canis TaxID=6265 RepID=A0A0B2UTB5_TOXCA|nr:Vacuolar protein sorting-associated protein VTA1 -like protein [Toxocara canis]
MAAAQQVPQSLRPIAHYVKIANENAARDPIIYYWCLFYAVQTGMSLDKSSPGALQYLTSLLSTLENTKKQLAGQEALTQDMVAQAHVENFALKLFEYADKNDRQSNFSKNVVKSFYTAGHLIDVLTLFGELDETLVATRRYAKWKATYIHNCLKNGETPLPGPPVLEGEGENLEVPVPPGPNTTAASRPGLPNEVCGSSTDTQHQTVPPDVPPERPIAPARSQPALDGSPAAAPTASSRSIPAPGAQVAAGESKSGSKGHSKLTMDDFIEAQKYAKYAVSALQYEDATTAIENMHKALDVLTKYD